MHEVIPVFVFRSDMNFLMPMLLLMLDFAYWQ